MRIGELARRAGIGVQAVRYYERMVGAIGSVLSVASVVAFLASPSYPASSALALAGYVLAAVIVLNMMFACLPAYRAANLDPIRCLRPVQ